MTKLISSNDLQEIVDEAMDRIGPNWRDNPVHRLLLDGLHDAIVHIEAIEQAARRRANVVGLMQDVYQDLRTPDALRKRGAL